MTLVSHFHAKDWKSFEDAWSEIMLSDGPIDDVLWVIDAAAEAKVMTRMLPFVREHADLLEQNGRHQDAAELLGRCLLGGGPPGELSTRLFRNAKTGWGQEGWWEDYTRLVDFHESTDDVRKAWRLLRQLIHLGPGSAVFHRSGWGVGEVTNLDAANLEAKVRFASGRSDRMPIKSIIETCEVLEPDDLRGLVVRDPVELSRLLKEEPLECLVGVLKRYNGRMNQVVLKSAMAQVKLEGTAFTSWWRRARKEAEKSNMVEVTGTGQKSQIRLLDKEVDPADSMRRQLRLARDLGAANTRVRDLLTEKDLSDELRAAVLDTLDELADGTTEADEHRLAAWMLLRAERSETPQPLRERLEEAYRAEPPTDPSVVPELWQLFHRMPGAREQEACIDLLKEMHGEEGWVAAAMHDLMHTPPGMVRGLIDQLVTAEQADLLAGTYSSLLVRPTRNPALFVGLAEWFERGKLQGEFTGPVQRLHSFLLLAGSLFAAGAGDVFRTRTMTRLTTLLSDGEPTLMQTLLADASKAEVRKLMPMLSKGVDGSIDRAFTHAAVQRFPDIFRDSNRPFWEEDGIWTSEAGLARREAELRELREVKIPANSEAIGKAASYGDLSENSEWEAAMEDQRTLTARAMEIEEELRQAQLIENAAIPQDVVAPGTQVTYRELDTGEERTVSVLGPWDTAAKGVISYRSPLAQSILGSPAGAQVTVKLPTGTQDIEVVAVEVLPLISRAEEAASTK
ncbi:GreA/GreB family elongation factor [Engelhardtia mirabilis]|uniref:Transcription elongation factor GreA n=1 Tax=Engelhardtia mirabilis TaxID=2528011 RepID=A0A518BKJ9_9BACT|nr:Transcription elongation factor GreA [Planctomycetes bacterium Pla133]QDV01825.1 Transcription elongation factor GreA [Planctomycetes bacterium Pla86]